MTEEKQNVQDEETKDNKQEEDGQEVQDKDNAEDKHIELGHYLGHGVQDN